jgi:chromosomal replication initiation ATPase DnaA
MSEIPDNVLAAFRALNEAHQRMLVAAEHACSTVAFYAGLAEAQAAAIPVIQRIVSQAYGVSREELAGPRRTAHLAEARQVAMWLCRSETKHTTEQIGAAFGRVHCTVSVSVRNVTDRADTEPKFSFRLATLSAQVQAALQPKAP